MEAASAMQTGRDASIFQYSFVKNDSSEVHARKKFGTGLQRLRTSDARSEAPMRGSSSFARFPRMTSRTATVAPAAVLQKSRQREQARPSPAAFNFVCNARPSRLPRLPNARAIGNIGYAHSSAAGGGGRSMAQFDFKRRPVSLEGGNCVHIGSRCVGLLGLACGKHLCRFVFAG